MRSALLALVAFLATTLPSQAEAVFRYNIGMMLDVPPTVTATAADTFPVSYDRAGLAEENRWFGDDQRVLDLLRDGVATESAINWTDSALAGSQRLELRFAEPIKANGCAVILQSRGAPTMPGVQFQAQRWDGKWTGWTAPVGGWDSTRSGNKTHVGDCGLGSAPIIAVAVRPSANGATGAIWYREFRLTWEE